MELAFVLGVVIGILAYEVIRRIFVEQGTLRIDHSNPEKDLYRFDIDDLDGLNKKTQIVLRIDHNANLSRK